MIIVDTPDADDATSTTRTLIPPFPKIPPHFVKLIALSIPLSLISLITCLLDLAVSWPVRAVPTILAFCASFPYHTGAVLLAWLHAHQIASILSFTPASPRSMAHAGLLAALWAVASGFNIHRAAQAMSLQYWCWADTSDPQKTVWDCVPYTIRGVHAVPTALAAATATAEALVLVVIVVVCFLHWRRGREHNSDLEMVRNSPMESETKVVSAST